MARKSEQIVLEALARAEGFSSAQDVHADAVATGQAIGLATVYRALRQLVLDGRADTLRGDDGEVRYRHCGGEHHHHLICRGCGRTREIAAGDIEAWTHAVAREHGFRDVHHVIELTGICEPCQSAR